jgi:hypothetical protein
VLTDPANAALARRAVPRPAPSTSYPFPVGYAITTDDSPAVVGGDALASTQGESDGAALARLNEKAEQERAKHPSMSPEQAFAIVYERHRDLAKAERRHSVAKLYRAA